MEKTLAGGLGGGGGGGGGIVLTDIRTTRHHSNRRPLCKQDTNIGINAHTTVLLLLVYNVSKISGACSSERAHKYVYLKKYKDKTQNKR